MQVIREKLSSYPNYSRLLLTLFLSLLIHILLFVKIGLPLDQLKKQQALHLEVQLARNKSYPPQQPSLVPITTANNTSPEAVAESPISKPALKESTKKLDQNPDNSRLNPMPESTSNGAELLEQKKNLTSTPATEITTGIDINIEFSINAVSTHNLLGLGIQHFSLDNSNNYKLSVRQISEQADHENDAWQFEITGKVFRDSLSTSMYYMNGEIAEQLLHLSRESNHGEQVRNWPKNGRMPDGILDRQSLAYQFMFSPPENIDNELVLTDGAKISTYKTHLVKVELLETEAFGKLSTAHMLLSNLDNNETIEMWLSPNYKYLPVKIRYTDSSGAVTEQLATSIDIKKK